MKIKYRMAIVWEDGSVDGYVGEGRDEDSARDNALFKVFEDSSRKRKGFKVVPPTDVPHMSPGWRQSLREDWERKEYLLDDADTYP